MSKNHVVITGTGRAGTTFLVQLLTELGCDTGFDDPQAKIFTNCRGGLDTDIKSSNAPYIVKHPELCDSLGDLLAEGRIQVDHVVIPMRDLFSAAQSRRDIQGRAGLKAHSHDVPGGLAYGRGAAEQEAVLAEKLYKLVHTLATYDVPVTLLAFPRLVIDPTYLFQKIAFLMDGVSWDYFEQTFAAISRPEWVHDFTSHGDQSVFDQQSPIALRAAGRWGSRGVLRDAAKWLRWPRAM